MIFESSSDYEYLLEDLRLLAQQESTPFCYQCYAKAPSGTCSGCGSDDLMRITGDNGPEYGFDWIIKDLIENNLSEVETGSFLVDFIDELYPKIVIGSVYFLASEVLKTCDPVSWGIFEDEELASRVNDGEMIQIDGKYFRTHELENYIDNNLLI